MDDSGKVLARIAQMRDAAAAIEQSAQRVSKSVDAAENEIQQLTADRFASDAADAFFRDYNHLTPQLREASNVLLRFRDKLVSAADAIEAAAHAAE
ncbi:MAG TPA: WXG100 family type VII secretion target [Phototrophicaceae bacterium]|nr:WXG100 family type VII secretion target [Phototrophicaceae bacterium]